MTIFLRQTTLHLKITHKLLCFTHQSYCIPLCIPLCISFLLLLQQITTNWCLKTTEINSLAVLDTRHSKSVSLAQNQGVGKATLPPNIPCLFQFLNGYKNIVVCGYNTLVFKANIFKEPGKRNTCEVLGFKCANV